MMSINQSAWYSIFAMMALKSAIVLGTAWIAAALLRGRSAAARHLVWTAAFAALLVLPFLAISLPPLRVASSIPLPSVVFQTTSTAPAETAEVQALHAAGVKTGPETPPQRTNPRPWLMLLWAAGTGIALLQMIGAMAVMWRLRMRAERFPDDDAAALTRALGIRQPVDVLAAGEGSMPMAYGLLRPAVFLPADAQTWSGERRRMVLLHELAHVRRGDLATHLLARVALSLYWWNPLAWTAWRSFLRERERATDDLVLSAGARASEYAGHLLEVARQMQSSSAMGWAAIAMARPSQLEGRLLAILDDRVNRKAPGRVAAAIAAVLAVGIAAPLAAVQSQDPAQQALPADVDATIRAANAQKNHSLLENAAAAAESLKKYDVAQALLESAVAIRADVSGERSREYGVGLIKLGDLEQKRNQKAEAEAFYRKAAGVLGNQPEAATAYMHLGTLALVAKDFEGAVSDFQQAQVADPGKAGSAMMWTALARERQGNVADAESLYRGALSLQGEGGPEAAVTMSLYAQMLQQNNRADEAAAMREQVATTRKAAYAQGVKSLSAGSSGVYRVGGGVSAPALLYKEEPEYSEEARTAKYQGTVTVYAEIGPDGFAHNTHVVQGLGLGLDQKALDAISRWRFKPGAKDGAPVTVQASIEVNFRLL